MAKKGDTSPDLGKQTKKDFSNDPDYPSKVNEQRMSSVFEKALICSTIFTATVIIIGESFHLGMVWH
jgi:hypothetical protein